jgi:hypothetical protein
VRYVKFIKALVIDERPVFGPDEYQYHVMENIVPLAGEVEEYLVSEQTVETMVVPIHEIRGANSIRPDWPPELYIAYSKNVQLLLEMPFDTIKRELEEARVLVRGLSADLACFRCAGLWGRLRYVFTRRKP